MVDLMTPGHAAWVRDNVWTKAMAGALAPTDACPCQYGPSAWCLNGSCHNCKAPDPVPFPETYVTDKSGLVCSWGESPFDVPTKSAAGMARSLYAMVWLADRICRWRCPCACHATPSRVLISEQLDLFAGVA